MLVPRLGAGTDVASLRADLEASRSQAALASSEAARMQRLFSQQAVSRSRVEEARSAQQIAQAQLRAAEQRSSQLGGGGGGVPVKAPISGTIALVPVANGASVEEGAKLFQIVDRRELWVEAHVSESDAARLQDPDGIAFDLPGLERAVQITPGANGRLVGVGSMIDPESRSVPVIFALSRPDRRIALNQNVQARVFHWRQRRAESGGRASARTMRPARGVRDGWRGVVLPRACALGHSRRRPFRGPGRHQERRTRGESRRDAGPAGGGDAGSHGPRPRALRRAA